MDKYYIKEDLGEDLGDLGVKPMSESSPVVLGTDTTYKTSLAVLPIPKEETEETMFGFAMQDVRTGIFADTHQYGIDERNWVTYSSLSQDDLLPIEKRLWLSGNLATSFREGVESQAFYDNSAVNLVTQSFGGSAKAWASCTTKQVFDCFTATNTFISFGLRRTGTDPNTVTQAGIFSAKTGWYLEIAGDGAGNSFRIVRRYTNQDNQTINEIIYRDSFVDQLNGTGSSRLVIDFSKVTMFAIEIGSYDGTAAKFLVYAADEGRFYGAHRWIMFHKVSISDLKNFPERNASPLPITVYHESSETIQTFAEKYGTSVTRAGTNTYPIKILNIPGSNMELVPGKFKFNFAFYTKELFNNKNNYTKHLVRSVNIGSTIPVEIQFRRYLLRSGELEDIGFKPIPKEEYDPSYLVYIVDDSDQKIKLISPDLGISVVSIDINADQLVYTGQLVMGLTATALSGSSLSLTGVTAKIVAGTVLTFLDANGNTYTATLTADVLPALSPTTSVSVTAAISGTFGANYQTVITSDHINIVYAIVKNTDEIAVINGSTGVIIRTFVAGTGVTDIVWVPGNNVVSNRLHVARNGGVSVYNTSDPMFPVLSINVTTTGVNPIRLATNNTQVFGISSSGTIFQYSSEQASNTTLSGNTSIFTLTNVLLRDVAAIGNTTYVLESQNGGTSWSVEQVNFQSVNPNTTPITNGTNLSSSLTSLVSIPNLNYLFAFGGTQINFFNLGSSTNTITTWTSIVRGIAIDALLNTYIYDSSGLIKEYFTFDVLADLSSASSILRGNLLSSGISSAIRDNGLDLIGEEVVSIVAGNKIRQLDLTYIFQEYREFFTSVYENFAGSNNIISQDLILVFLRHLGENLSTFIEQIEWVSGTTNVTISNPVTLDNPLHVSVPGSATISLVNGQI